MPIAQKNDSRGANASIVEPGADAGAQVLDAVGQRVASSRSAVAPASCMW